MTEFNTAPRFVTPDDFFNYTGRNLDEILQPNENESNKSNLFLKDIEEDLMFRVDHLSFRIYSWENLTDYQKDCLRRAIIKQAEYVLRNGNLMTDSGYDIEKGKVITRSEIEEIALCIPATDALQSCGLLNRVVKNYHRYPRSI